MGINQNSWKSLQFSISASIVKRIDLERVFDDNNFVRPNFIQIKNLNSSDSLYLGDNQDVSSTNFRLAINALSTGKSISIEGFSDLYLLCASNINDLEINYAYDDAPSATDLDGTQDIYIQNNTVTVGDVGISSIDSGTNTIGKVHLTDGTDDVAVNSDNTLSVKDAVNGDQTDDKTTETGTGSASVIALLKQMSYQLQNALDVGSIATGANTIGAVKVKDSAGTNELKVNADGSIDTNGSFTGTIGTVKLHDTTESYILDIDSSGFITSKLSGSIPAGTNNIGDVDVASLPTLPAGTNNIGDVDIDTIPDSEIVKPSTTPVIYNVTCTSASTEYSQALPSNCKKFSIGLKSKDSGVTWVLKFGASGTEFSLEGNETLSEDNLLLSSQTLYFESDTAGEIVQIIAYS